MLVELSMLLASASLGYIAAKSRLVASASLGYIAAKSRLGQRKSQEPSEWSKLHLSSSGFFGLLRNLRPAKRAGPDFGLLFAKLGCHSCSGNNGVIRRWYGNARLRHETDQTSVQTPLRK